MNNSEASPLGGATVHDLWSDAVQDTFRVFTAACGENPRSVLFVTDANGLFGLAVDTIRLMQLPGLVPSMLVVGIGYPNADALIDTIDVRVRDLTPTTSSRFEQSGGADRFMGFIRSELREWLEDRYPTAFNTTTFFGHSLGGLFGAYVMLTEPDLFDRYILSSPSLWWDNEYIFELERNKAGSGQRLDASAVIGIGSLETDEGRRAEAINLPEGHPAKPPAGKLDMVADARRFAAQVISHDGLDLQYMEIADEFHATMPGVLLSRALRHLSE